jgi:hypothetical protein
VETELKTEGISADDLAYLRDKEKQLREEKKQLREEKKQLRDKEKQLLLTKSLANGARARTLKRFPSPSQHVVHS